MKKTALIASTILCATTLFAGVATAGDWWRTVSVTASQGIPADHNQVCANAESQLRSRYSDVTAVNLRIGFDQYAGRLYCTAVGQTQQ